MATLTRIALRQPIELSGLPMHKNVPKVGHIYGAMLVASTECEPVNMANTKDDKGTPDVILTLCISNCCTTPPLLPQLTFP